jgi:hypothetical protein
METRKRQRDTHGAEEALPSPPKAASPPWLGLGLRKGAHAKGPGPAAPKRACTRAATAKAKKGTAATKAAKEAAAKDKIIKGYLDKLNLLAKPEVSMHVTRYSAQAIMC